MWFDESVIRLFSNYSSFVRRKIGCRYKVKFIVPTVKHPQSIMLWLWHRYLGILQETCNTLGTFMHDATPCHKAKTVTDWLQQNGFSVLDWPCNSPDLNPLENLWRIVKQKVSQRKPRNYVELIK